MPPEDNIDNLPWFHQLEPDEQVHLLSHPSSDLSEELVEKLNPHEVLTFHQWEDNPRQFTLAPQPAETLRQQRKQLDSWFDNLSQEDQDYFIEHRKGHLAKEYLHKAREASGPHLRVLIDTDPTDDYSFELTPFLRAYLAYRAQ